MNKPLDPLSVERTETPSASYVLRRRYGPVRHIITIASWVTVIGMLFQPVAVLAATRNWDGDTDTAWGTAGNWDIAPVSDLTTDLANFNNIGPYQAASTPRHPNAGTVSIKGITIGASNGAMTLSGTALSIGADGITIASGAGALAISSPITLGGSQTWANNSANTLTVSGNIANCGKTLTINGTGEHTFVPDIEVAGLTVANGTVNFNSTAGGTQPITQAFTSSGTLVLPNDVTNAKILLVGGGGGGGGSLGGGGGGGGVIWIPNVNLPGGSYTITVGGSGSAGTGLTTKGGSGGLSRISDGVNIATAAGGGGGGCYNNPQGTSPVGVDGGSGGGAGATQSAAANGGNATGSSLAGVFSGAGTIYGSRGGNVTTARDAGDSIVVARGGGGAGAAATDGTASGSATAGSGGVGIQISDSSLGIYNNLYWGGGGGGGAYNPTTASAIGGNGGLGGGGGGAAGSVSSQTGATQGSGGGSALTSGATAITTGGAGGANTGGGGGGGWYNGGAGVGGLGGTGFVYFSGNVFVAPVVTLTGGTINFGSTDAGAKVRILDVSAGTGTARADYAQPLTIESQLKLPSGVTATVSAGSTFTSKGSNLANNSTARTLTLSGGTLELRNSGTGGTITYSGGNVIHTFTTAGENTLSVSDTSAPNATVYIWGGGGGGGYNSSSGAGGGGGYTTGTLAMTLGKTYKIMVGGGGASIGASGGAGPVVPGGGGQLNSSGGWGGQGGGLSGIFDTSYTFANALAIAGGGGGGVWYENTSTANGGPGGGTTGIAGDNGSQSGGGGGTQSAGGTSVPSEGAGSALQGGVPATYLRADGVNDTGGGGGGGGGYYGGGAGNNDSYHITPPNPNGRASGGGGGSGYVGGLSGATTTAGSGTTPGNQSGYYISGRGVGGASGNNAGGAGLVVVVHPIAGINLPDTAIAATATSTLDLAASTKDHILGNVNVTAGATLTVDNANKLTMGTLTIGINGANCGKLNLGTKELILGNGSVTKLVVTSTSPTVQAYCVAEAKAGSFTTLNGTSVTDDTGKKWNVKVRAADGVTVDANGPQLWLVTVSGGTVFMFK